jgi:hypothetical protein
MGLFAGWDFETKLNAFVSKLKSIERESMIGSCGEIRKRHASFRAMFHSS